MDTHRNEQIHDPGRARATLLLLDDDPLILQVLGLQLRHLGFTSFHAFQHGADAIATLERGGSAVDVVFCDLQMPGMNGADFVHRLVELDLDRPPALVFVSGDDDQLLQDAEQIAAAHQFEVLARLHKPFTLARLREVLAPFDPVAGP